MTPKRKPTTAKSTSRRKTRTLSTFAHRVERRVAELIISLWALSAEGTPLSPKDAKFLRLSARLLNRHIKRQDAAREKREALRAEQKARALAALKPVLAAQQKAALPLVKTVWREPGRSEDSFGSGSGDGDGA